MPPIEIQNLTVDFPGGVRAIDGLSLVIPASEFLVLVGPSGCGKSTLLRALAGLAPLTRGSIAGVDRDAVSFVFQDANLLPWRKVDRNVALPLELRGTPRNRRLATARQTLAAVGLADAARRYPAQLSGGMKMRASVARALTIEPTLLLMDEPFGALDEITRFRLDDLARQTWARAGNAVVFVTHSLAEALYLGTRVVVLSKRPAKIVLDHRVDLPVQRDASTRLAPEFTAQLRLLQDALTRAEGDLP